MANTTAWVGRLLEENSTKKYFINHGQYFFNHISHSIVALQRLGATEPRVKQHIEKTKKWLHDPGLKQHQNEALEAHEGDVQLYRGKHTW